GGNRPFLVNWSRTGTQRFAANGCVLASESKGNAMTPTKLGLVVATALVLASPALAQLKQGYGKPLNEAETKAALLGIDMRGYSPTYGFSWRECIQPNGETLYETPDAVLKGRLT